MRKFLLGCIIGLFAVSGVAFASTMTTKDHNRRLAGPFCVSNSTGVVRSIAVTRKCRPGEIRKVGLAITDKDVDVDPKPVPGQTGATGASGVPGPQGPQGPAGPPGVSPSFQTTTLCVNKNNSVSWGGDDGKLCKPTCQMILTIVITGEQPPVPVTTETVTTVQ